MLSKKQENLIIAALWILAALVMIKSIFTDFGYDNAYQIAMSYRHICGDRMLLEMWEPHQTSKFFTDIMLLIYRAFVPDYTGIAIFMQIVGTVVSLMIASAALKVMGRYLDRITKHALLVFLVIFKVKQTPFIDYAGQMILLSVLVFVFLFRWEETESPLYPLLAGACTFLEVLSYPTALIAILPAVVFLVTGSVKKKIPGLLIYLAGGGVPAVIYALYFVLRLGIGGVLETAELIFGSDSHSSTPHFGAYWLGFLQALAVLAACVAAGAVIWSIAGRKKKISLPVLVAAVMTAAEPILIFVTNKTGFDVRCFIFIVPVILILCGLAVYRKMERGEKRIWLFGTLFSFSSFLAAMLLSDLGIITICAYLMLGGAVSYIPLKYLCREYRQAAVLVTCLILFHRGLVVWGYGNYGSVNLSTEVQNIVREGPAVGIVCDNFNRAKFSVDYRELRALLKPEDRVLVVGSWLMDPLMFLYTEAEISNYSVIDTPVYNETLEEYFRRNPGKYPTVVLVDCWFGNLNVSSESYVMKWVERNFTKENDLSYYRVYR